MKTAIGLLLLVAVAFVVIYYAGGYASFDPTKQGEEAKAAITPGMTARQVLDVAGSPPRYSIYRVAKKRIDGEEEEFVERGAVLDFDRSLFLNDLTAGSMPAGFVFFYHFSYQCAFEVVFDASGKVESLTDSKTAADLLQTRSK